MKTSQKVYEDCLEIYLDLQGRRVLELVRRMHKLGHSGFNRRILYDRNERKKVKPGWIKRFEWKKLLAAETRRRGADTAAGSQQEGFIPALETDETCGGKPAFPTATGSSSFVDKEKNNREARKIHEKTRTEESVHLSHSAVETASGDFHSWLRRVSPGMTWDWRHQTHIIEQLEKVTSGECRRLMIFVPPRHGKSELVTVRYSAWRMRREPSLNIILGSYNQRLADRFSRKIRKVITDSVAIENGEMRNENGEMRIENGEPPRSSTSSQSTPVSRRQQRNEDKPLDLPTKAGSPFPFASSRPANSVSEWETSVGGGFRSVGVGGGVTGFGAQLIVIDDPVKSRAEAESEAYRERLHDWFNDDLYTRLEPGGAIILIQTRWHEDDLAGRLLREMSEGGEQWDVIDLPALSEPSVVTDGSPQASVGNDESRPIQHAFRNPPLTGCGSDWRRSPGLALCPERFDETKLDEIRRKLGTYSFSALYQQRPTPAGGGTFKREWFKRIAPHAPPGLKWKRGYDLAVSTRTNADYTASFRCAFDAEGNLYIADGFRKRIEFPDQRRFIIDRIKNEPDTEHGIELALHGQALIQDLRRIPGLCSHLFRGVKVETDKLTRALAWAPLAEEGKVILVRSADTPFRVPSGWIGDFLDEAASFPHGPHDDQIDAISLAVQMLKKRPSAAAGF